jgi:hypothetical protein
MSDNTIDNPSPKLTEDRTENISQDITGNSTLLENTVPENTTPESPVETSHQESASCPPAYQTNRSSKYPAGRKSFLKMSKEQLMAAIGEVTENLGHVPSHAELMRSGKVSGRQIVKHFGTYTRALRACNLERSTGGHKVPLEKLFLDWARVVREVKRIPSKADDETMGKHSITPLRASFVTWGQVPR